MALNKGYNIDDFFGTLTDSLESQFSSDVGDKNVIEFVEEVLDKKELGLELDVRQKLVLKTFYGLPLDEEDIAIIQAWKAMDRTTYDLDLPPRRRQSMVIEAGRRGSKTLCGALIIGYEFYKLCMKPSPQLHYGMAANSPISIYCIATAASQTKKTIFGQARGLLNYIPFIKRLIDKKEIIVGEEEIKYPGKKLYIYSGNSKSASQVGSAVICMVLDEAARFQDNAGENNALELWSNLGISGVTFGQDAVKVAISSAWCEGDAIQKLYQASNDDPTWIGYRLRTWDLNPKHGARDNPVIQSEYTLNPSKAALEFEGIRNVGDDSFFNNQEDVKKSFQSLSKIDCGVVKQDGLVKIRVDKVEPFSGRTVMHLDPAVVTDNYGMAFGHAEKDSEDKVIVVIDGVLAWEPDATHHVSITNVQEVIYQIHQHRPISKVTADHHNSAETLQRLKQAGINTQSMYASNKTQMEMYQCAYDLICEGRLKLPKNSPWTRLLKEEMLYIQKTKTSTQHPKISHLKDKTKDLIDCVVSVAWELAGSIVYQPAIRSSLTNTTKTYALVSPKQEDLFQTGRLDLRRELRAKRNII